MSDEQVRYPWDKWFKRAKFRLTRNVDFICQQHSMVQQIRSVAAARGISVSITVDGDVLEVEKK